MSNLIRTGKVKRSRYSGRLEEYLLNIVRQLIKFFYYTVLRNLLSRINIH